MAAEILEDDEKILKTVFKKAGYIVTDDSPYGQDEEKWKPESRWEQTTLMKKRMASEFDVVRTELDKARIQKENVLVKIVKAVRKAIIRENIVTDKFLQDVKSLVKCFKSELDKMQELLNSILKKLPEVQLDIAETA